MTSRGLRNILWEWLGNSMEVMWNIMEIIRILELLRKKRGNSMEAGNIMEMAWKIMELMWK